MRPATPARVTGTPIEASTPTSSTPRKAQRVPTATPAECVRQVLVANQPLPSPRRMAARATPVASTLMTNSATPVRNQVETPLAASISKPRSAARVVVASPTKSQAASTPIKASRVVIETPVVKKVAVTNPSASVVAARSVDVRRFLTLPLYCYPRID